MGNCPPYLPSGPVLRPAGGPGKRLLLPLVVLPHDGGAAGVVAYLATSAVAGPPPQVLSAREKVPGAVGYGKNILWGNASYTEKFILYLYYLDSLLAFR